MPANTDLEGFWLIESAELSGEKMPDLVAHKIEVELVAGSYAVRFGGEVADRGTFELGPHPAGAAITLTGVAGTNAGRTIPAIYRLAGEHLHICYGLDGAMPSEFATSAGAALFLASYRRRAAKS